MYDMMPEQIENIQLGVKSLQSVMIPAMSD